MKAFLAAHWGDIVQTVLFVASFAVGRGYVKDAKLARVIEEAVAFAEQWRKKESARIGERPDGPAALSMARAYIEDNAPEMADKVTNHMIDAAIGKVLGAKAQTRLPNGQFAKR